MKKNSFIFGLLALALVLGLVFTGCDTGTDDDGGNGGGGIAYEVESKDDDGSTTYLKFYINGYVPDLALGDITITDETGSVTFTGNALWEPRFSGDHSETTYTLHVITTQSGTIKVKITRADFDNSERTLTVYK
jgi:hypothetical protein